MAKPNDWTKSSLLGKVKTAHVDSAALANNAGEWIEEPRVPVRTTRYNEAGYIIKELFFALDGQVSKVGFTKYDSDWNKTEVLVQNPNGGLLSLLVCEYDDKGHELGSVLTSAPGLITRQKSTPVYDQAGNKVEETWFWEDGTTSRKYAYKYSEDGRLSEQLTYKYTEHGSFEEKWVSRYSEAGQIVETFCLDADDQLLIGRTTYEYDERGNEREVAAHNINGDPYSLTSYTHVFDSVGNWIKRNEEFKTNQSGFETRSVVYRTLTYY